MGEGIEKQDWVLGTRGSLPQSTLVQAGHFQNKRYKS